MRVVTLKKAGLLVLACSSLVAMASPAAAECMRGPFKVRLPAGRLDTRLQGIAHKTGCPLEVDTKIVGSKRVRALRGSYTDAQMLNLSLARSGLISTWQDDHWVVRPHD